MFPGGTDPVLEMAAQVEVEAQTAVVGGVAIPKVVPRAIQRANPRAASAAVQRNRVTQMMHQEVLD